MFTYQPEAIIMNILVTLDRNYLPALRVLLLSTLHSNPGESFAFYIISDDLTQEDLASLSALCSGRSVRFRLIRAGEELFSNAPTLRYYSRAMYFRLLAAQLLPQDIDRILYLDPDILVIGPLRRLYDLELGDCLYAAAMHKGLVNLSGSVNKIRLSTYESEGYYNSGVLLMNLPQIRERVLPQDIFDYVARWKDILLLPDQDVLNGLYGEYILPLDEKLWNYDARKYREYLLATQGEANLDWVMRHTSILHFCGKNKPWKKHARGRFAALYRHYMRLCDQLSD